MNTAKLVVDKIRKRRSVEVGKGKIKGKEGKVINVPCVKVSFPRSAAAQLVLYSLLGGRK